MKWLTLRGLTHPDADFKIGLLSQNWKSRNNIYIKADRFRTISSAMNYCYSIMIYITDSKGIKILVITQSDNLFCYYCSLKSYLKQPNFTPEQKTFWTWKIHKIKSRGLFCFVKPLLLLFLFVSIV